MKMFTRLLLSFFLFNAAMLQSGKSFAHTVDYFNCCGYTCAGSSMNVSAHLSNTNSSSKYNWQYRDNSKTWKCFAYGNNIINGVNFFVTGVYATGYLTTSPTLSIANAQSNLNDVEIRLLIADGGSPCASSPSYTLWGGDKSLRLHVLAGSDCSAISNFCSMGGCIGNTLSCTDGYYGGFEVGSGSLGPAGTDYTYVSSNSSCGQYSIVNSASKIYSFFPMFAPHSGNYMLYVDGANTASKRFWYKTVSVTKGNMYEFSAWIANAANTSNQRAAVRLKVTGTNSAEAVKTVTSTAGDWQYVKVTYVASATCTVTLSMSDDNCSCQDNDFVVDDICFKCDGPAPKLRLGNLVWNDYDGDGKRDPNENAIGGITVFLYTDDNGDNKPDGAAIKSTLTDIKGAYLFTDLTPGRYITSIPVLLGYSPSPNNSTTTNGDPNNNVDNDNNAVNLVSGVDYTNAITLTAGEEPTTDGDDASGNLTMDMALCGNAFIGDFVWNDLNGNGIQDPGEPGINDQLVTITFTDGTTATTVTHNYGFDGYYNFPNLGGGTYKITFTTPAGLFPSPSNVGGDDAKDSDPVNGSTTVVLTPNVSDFTIDAGFTAYRAPVKLSLGNLVWNDYNNNGIRDSGEPGLGGLAVTIYKDMNGDNMIDSASFASTTTASNGTYVFNNLAAGKYIIAVAVPATFMQSEVGDGTPDDNIDNDNNGIGTYQNYVYTHFITLSPGAEPVNDGNDNNSNFTLDIGLTCHTSCHNDCNHTNCGHPNCGHNSCHNDCNHTTCGHPNCAHNSCHNDCNHTNCGHPNCGHNSCHNDCNHTTCGHPNCSHNSCNHNCNHVGCGHWNCKKFWWSWRAPNKKHSAYTNSTAGIVTPPSLTTTAAAPPTVDPADVDPETPAANIITEVITTQTAPETAETTTAQTAHATATNTALVTDYKLWSIDQISKTTMTVYPNPANNYFTLKVNSASEGKAAVRIIDMSGRVILSQNAEMADGLNLIKFNELNKLRAGTYTVQLVSDGQVFNQKLVIAK